MPFPNSEFVRNGRFTDAKEIGQGAYGKVYRARDNNLGRDVAVKEVLPSSEAVRESRARFEKEARIQAKLNHPNIISVYSLEKDDATGEWYLISEYANGGSLADYLEHHGKLPEEMAVHIALDIGKAIAEIWDKRIVHRDIKPSNILLVRNTDGHITAKLGDFGVAQDQQSARTTIAEGSSQPGTPAYMAPEQSSSANILDARADIYALGITLWEMLTAKDYKPLLGQASQPNLHKYNTDVSGRLAKVIRASIQTDRLDRYQSPADLIEDLKLVQHGKEPRRVMKHNTPNPNEGYYTQRKWLWGLLAIGLLLIFGGGVYAYSLLTGSEDEDAVVMAPTTTTIPDTPTATPLPLSPTPTFEPQSVCQVPGVIGLNQSAAETLLTDLRLQPSITLQFNPDVPAGRVLAQNPEPGTRLDPCEGDVSIVISREPEPTVTVAPTEIPTENNTPVLSGDLTGDWDMIVNVNRGLNADSTIVQADDVYNIAIVLSQNGGNLDGEFLEASSNACDEATISGAVQGNQVNWTIYYTGSCCNESEMRFEGEIRNNRTVITGELIPVGVPSSNCRLWWADLEAVKR